VQAAAAHGLPLLVVGERAGRPQPGVCQVQERDGLLRDWLTTGGLIGALVRPDHHVYGGFATPAEALTLLQQQRAATQPHATRPHEGDTHHAPATHP
jgi:hypothetical protein